MKVTVVETETDRAAAFAIRRAVFIEEQAIPEAEEWDDHDATATHLLIRTGGAPAATARLIADGATAKIGRVAVMADRRGSGLGHEIMAHALQLAETRGFLVAALDAQVTAIAFYESLGFVAHSPDFDDGSGILHRRMTRRLAPLESAANRGSTGHADAPAPQPEGASPDSQLAHRG